MNIHRSYEFEMSFKLDKLKLHPFIRKLLSHCRLNFSHQPHLSNLNVRKGVWKMTGIERQTKLIAIRVCWWYKNFYYNHRHNNKPLLLKHTHIYIEAISCMAKHVQISLCVWRGLFIDLPLPHHAGVHFCVWMYLPLPSHVGSIAANSYTHDIGASMCVVCWHRTAFRAFAFMQSLHTQ